MSRAAVVLWLVALAGCTRSRATNNAAAAVAETGGDVARGKAMLAGWGCGACHTIPGVQGARGLIAPPLNAFSQRAFIGGEIPNTPGNLVRWIMHPQSLLPKTAMPDLGAPEQSARNMAAYLYSLR